MDAARIVERCGSVIIPDVLPSLEVDALIRHLAQSPMKRSRAGFRHALRDTNVAAMARDHRIVDIASKILGGKALPFRATLFDKSADANWLVVWHQDTALPLQNRSDAPGWSSWSVKAGVTYAHAPADVLCRVLALRVHLDDSTSQNGPLRVLPGTHTRGVLSDDAIEELSSQIEAAECLVAKGGVLAMRPLLVHASSKSHSARPRRVLHIEYATSMKVGEQLELALA
jgi:ectoine hydroxylase-related dioxygenase (phytanoyl-CoA dioxygenase family)